MRPIKIVCLNSAMDQAIEVAEFAIGSVLRATRYDTFASGKGINSAFALASLGIPSILYTIAGSDCQDSFTNLHRFISERVVIADGRERRNVTITERGVRLVCHLQTQGPELSDSLVSSLTSLLYAEVTDDDVVILSGSLPNGIGHETIAGIIDTLSVRGAKIILDVDPEYCRQVRLSNVFWMKPNIEEWRRYTEQPLPTPKDVIAFGIPPDGPENVLVSLGQAGGIAMSRNDGRYLRGWTSLDREVERDPIGCGDAMVAGIAVAVSENGDFMATLKSAIGAGYANLFERGPGRLSPSALRYANERFAFSDKV